MLTCWHKSL